MVDDTVAPVCLGLIERLIGKTGGRFQLHTRFCFAQPNTDSQTFRYFRQFNLADLLTNTLRDERGTRHAGFRQQHQKLFSAPTGEYVHVTDAVLEYLGDCNQCLIPNIMPMSIVNLLEVVDVEHHHE